MFGWFAISTMEAILPVHIMESMNGSIIDQSKIYFY